MSSLLRSANHLRLCFNLNRALITSAPRTYLRGKVLGKQILPPTTTFSKHLSSYAEPEGSFGQSIDSAVEKLDRNVRRTCRVNKIELENAIRIVYSSRSLTGSQALLLLRCCGSLLPEVPPEKRTAKAEELWNRFEKMGVKFDISHYNALLKVYLENEHKFSPTEFLARLEEGGIQPNRVTFQRLISHYCLVGDIDGATKILEFMKSKDMPINEQIFNSLIWGHAINNDFDSAEGIISTMKDAGIKPSNETYAALLRSHAKAGNISKINEIINQCESSDIFFLDTDILEVAYQLAVNGHTNLISEILDKMPKSSHSYNQDVINTILRLIAAGQEDAAYVLYETMEKTSSRMNESGEGSIEGSNDGNFFVRQLVLCNRPLEKIKHYTSLFAQENSNPGVYAIAVRAALHKGDIELSKKILLFSEENGFQIRPHYFWPLIKAAENRKDADGIYQVIYVMINDFNIFQLRETMREFAVPDLISIGEPWDKIHETLTSLGVPSGAVASPIALTLLSKYNIKDAAVVVSQFRAYYQPYFFRVPLIKAFFKTHDLESFLTIARHVYLSVQRQEEMVEAADDSEEFGATPDKKILMSKLTYEVVSHLVKDKSDYHGAEEFLKGMLANGLGITSNCAEKIQNWIPNLTPELAEVIERLTSVDLQPIPIETQGRIAANSYDKRALLQIVESLKRKGKPTDTVQIQLFNLYCRSKELEKALEVKQELEENGVIFHAGHHALLIDLYVSVDELDKALELLESLQKDDSAFVLDAKKTLKLATLLYQKGRPEDATQLLEKYPEQDSKWAEDSSFNVDLQCQAFLREVGEKDGPEAVEKFLDLLVAKKIAEKNARLLGPVIAAYLIRDDLKGALDKFEHFCHTYNHTVLKKELMSRFIQAEDAVSLQRVTDLSTGIHGEVSSLYDLMGIFIQLGRIRQARKILETPGLRIRQDRLELLSNRFVEKKNEEGLQRLLEVTKGVLHVDRSKFYEDYLELYRIENNVEKAYGLWTQMQEDDETPSDEFLVKLADLLKKHNKEVPFAIPERKWKEENNVNVDRMSAPQRFQSKIASQKTRARTGQSAFNYGGNNSLSPKEKLVESLVLRDELHEAHEKVVDMLKDGSVPSVSLLRLFCERLSKAGHIDLLKQIGDLISKDQKKDIYFKPKLCDAYKVQGKLEEFFEELAHEVDNIQNDEDVVSVLPLRTIAKALFAKPDLLPHLEALSAKLNEKGYDHLEATLWAVYFMTNSHPEKAEKLIETLSKSGRLYYAVPLREAENTFNLDLFNRLKQTVVPHITEENIPYEMKALYNTELSILNAQGKIEEAISSLESAEKYIDISTLDSNTLRALKSKAEINRIPFKYDVPEKTQSYQSIDRRRDWRDA